MNWKLYLATLAALMLHVVVSKLATVHANIDNTASLNPLEKAALDRLTDVVVNTAEATLAAHVATLAPQVPV